MEEKLVRGATQSPRALRSAVILAGLVLSLLAASPATAAVRTEFFGISQSMHRFGPRDFPRMATEAKVRTERFQLHWPDVQPTQGTFDWSEFDAFVGTLASNGLRPVPVLFGTPRWVGPNFARPPIDSAADEQAWRDFLREAVDRY